MYPMVCFSFPCTVFMLDCDLCYMLSSTFRQLSPWLQSLYLIHLYVTSVSNPQPGTPYSMLSSVLCYLDKVPENSKVSREKRIMNSQLWMLDIQTACEQQVAGSGMLVTSWQLARQEDTREEEIRFLNRKQERDSGFRSFPE